TFLTQFLRLAVASGALRDENAITTATLRSCLRQGNSIEVAGYTLAPALATAIDSIDLTEWAVPKTQLRWLDVRAVPTADLPPAINRQITTWRQRGITVCYKSVAGESFWMKQEISAVPS